jgi:lipopolysaccharide heptosyltransferase II
VPRATCDVRILLVRLRLIGDVVFTTPIPRALKRAYPGAEVSYVVERSAAAVVARNPHIDDVIVVDRPRGLARLLDDLKLAAQLRRRRYDIAIDLHGGPRSSWLTWATGAPQRIGYAIPGRRWMYTRSVDRPRELRARHSVRNQWDLLEAIEGWPGGTPDPARDAVDMAADPAVDARIAARLEAASVSTAHEIVVVHVSAGNPFRRWPEESFTKLVAGIASISDRRRIVLSSGPSDRDAAARIGARARGALGINAPRILDFGDIDLAELRSLVARSRLFIGGDTGPLHVAATTTTPIVGLFGPTLAERSAPWRDPGIPTESLYVAGLPCRPCDQRVCEPGDFRCLTTLSPDDVLAAAERVMKAIG